MCRTLLIGREPCDVPPRDVTPGCPPIGRPAGRGEISTPRLPRDVTPGSPRPVPALNRVTAVTSRDSVNGALPALGGGEGEGGVAEQWGGRWRFHFISFISFIYLHLFTG